jgi:hypothetical protein
MYVDLILVHRRIEVRKDHLCWIGIYVRRVGLETGGVVVNVVVLVVIVVVSVCRPTIVVVGVVSLRGDCCGCVEIGECWTRVGTAFDEARRRGLEAAVVCVS